MTIVETEDFYADTLVRKNPDTLYIFGDNLQKRGFGGQAIIRANENAMGIPTKKRPSMRQDAFFTDAELESNVIAIDAAIDQIQRRLDNDKNIKRVVFPTGGLGTGLAQLAKKAPLTAAKLDQRIAQFAETIQTGSAKRLTFSVLK